MFFDQEPIGDGVKVSTTWDWVYAFNWYFANAGEREASKYLGCSVELAKDFETLAWTKRLLERGYVLGEKEKATYEAMTKHFEKRLALIQEQTAVKEEKPVVNIQERIQDKALEFFDTIEDEVMELAASGDYPKFYTGKIKLNFYDKFQKWGMKSLHAKIILNRIFEETKDWNEELKSEDEDQRNRMKRIIWLYSSVSVDLHTIVRNQNVDRKPRKKKVITADKLIKDLKFLKESTEFKIKSIDPSRIVGATQLWTFNVKYRQLGLLIAEEGKTFTVRGSTIYGVDEKKSYTKTLRKPLEVLDKIVSGARKTNQALMEKINSKPAPFPGRINKDVVLLKVENK